LAQKIGIAIRYTDKGIAKAKVFWRLETFLSME